MVSKEELLNALELIATGGYAFKASEKDFDNAEELLKSFIDESTALLNILKRNLKFETVTLYDCENGDVYYNRAYLNVNENNLSDFHNLLTFGKEENLIDDKKMWW